MTTSGESTAVERVSHGDGLAGATVLVVGDQSLEAWLRMRLPTDVGLRSVASASETEGIGIDLVVIGGRASITEAVEIGVHPTLFDKPVVLISSEEKGAGIGGRTR